MIQQQINSKLFYPMTLEEVQQEFSGLVFRGKEKTDFKWVTGILYNNGFFEAKSADTFDEAMRNWIGFTAG